MKISEVINMLMKSIDEEIEILIDTGFPKFTFDSTVFLLKCVVSNQRWRRSRMGTQKEERKRWKRGARFGLEIPVTYTLNGHGRPIEWIK